VRLELVDKSLIGTYLLPELEEVATLGLDLGDIIMFKEWIDFRFGGNL
jgi:hypothetical protein